MQALKVTFNLSSPMPINSEYPIHMDAIIASAVCKLSESMGSETPWQDADDLSGYLDKTAGDDWVWKASRLMFTPTSGILFQNQIRKSDPDRYFEDLANYWAGKNPTAENPIGSIRENTFKINTGSGQQRGYQWLNAYQWIAKAEAWVFGDKDALEYLLGTISHVGKMSRNDFGRVESITVEASDDTDHWKLRYLPASEAMLEGVEYAETEGCLRAPYWKKMNKVCVKEPII